jgi:hypothetical protein
MVSVWTSSPGLVTSGRLGLSLRTHGFCTPSKQWWRRRMRRTLLRLMRTVRPCSSPMCVRWCQTTSAQRFSVRRTLSTCCTTESATALGLVCGREVSVGMSHWQAASRKLLLGLACNRLDRLSLVRLDIFVQHLPFALPAPNGTAVNTAAICDGLQWQLLTNEQLHSKSSRFW